MRTRTRCSDKHEIVSDWSSGKIVTINEDLSIDTISPDTVTKGQTETFTLRGRGFQNGFSAKIINELGQEWDISQKEYVNSETVRVTVLIGEGSQTVTQYIRIINPDNQSAQIGFTAEGVQIQEPVARFSMSFQGNTAYENDTLNLTVSSGGTASVSFSGQRSTDSDGQIVSYEWKISGTQVSTSRDFSFSLGEGTHHIYLTVTDDDGATGSVGGTVVVSDTSITYQGHFSNTGWGSWRSNGGTIGSPGGNQMEAIKIQVDGYSISYRAHVAYDGWHGWVSNGATGGTTGQGKALEAIEIQLSNAPSNLHVTYRAYVQGLGWQNWVSDGSTAGTTGQARAIQAIEIKLEVR